MKVAKISQNGKKCMETLESKLRKLTEFIYFNFYFNMIARFDHVEYIKRVDLIEDIEHLRTFK